MLRLLSAALFVAVLIPAASAQEGSYVGSGEGDLTVEIQAKDADGFYPIDFSTTTPMEDGMGGCSGGVSGTADIEGKDGMFYASNEDYDPAAVDDPISGYEYCEIALSFKGDRLVIEEGTGCLVYHGAACGFTGELALQR